MSGDPVTATIPTQQVRAALRLIGDSDITPAGRRVLEAICDEAEGIGASYPTSRCALGQHITVHHKTDHCFCWLNAEEPCCWCGDDSEGEGPDAVCPGVSSGSCEDGA